MATEKRLVAYDPIAFESLARRSIPYNLYDRGYLDAASRIKEWLEANVVGAVEVVRCEHCIHSLSDGWICGGPSFTMPSHPTYPDAFCSYGERSGNDG